MRNVGLQDDISNRVRNAVRDYAYEHNYSFFDLRNQVGMLCNMIIRTTMGELMVILIRRIDEEHQRKKWYPFKKLLQHMADSFPRNNFLLYIINNKCNDTITEQRRVCLQPGNDYIYEEMEGLKFKIGPKSFYQTNSEQAYNLYKITETSHN